MLLTAGASANRPDERIGWLTKWIANEMTPNGRWSDRRLIIFTEYEDTRRWLQRRLEEVIADVENSDDRIQTLTGATSVERREEIKLAFNGDPQSNPVRILVCTDAAREGINLQMRCHDLIHFDLPWNPSRLEQRNGRIDRKLQPSSEVTCRYFIYPQRKIDVVLNALFRKTDKIRIELGSLGKVIEDRISDALIEGVSLEDASRLATQIETETGGDALERARDELELAETTKRRSAIADNLEKLDRRLEESRKKVGVDPLDLSSVVNVALGRAGEPLSTFKSGNVGSTMAYSLEPDHQIFDGWQGAFDDLRVRPRKRGERPAKWRQSAPVRRIAFASPELENGRFADDVVHVHLEHRLVRRLLSRFVSQGFQSGLERVCALQSTYSEPRVALLGRLSLYGVGAARLHEEVIPITARWSDKERGDAPLSVLGARGEGTTLEQLSDALKTAKPVDNEILSRLQKSIEQDLLSLRPELEKRADESRVARQKDLMAIGIREAKAISEILTDQKKRIEREASSFEVDQLALPGLGDAERRQKKRDVAWWQKKVDEIDRELDSEPQRVQAGYEVQASRLEPIGLVYLWPKAG